MRQIISCIRVSTQQQGKSGLGVEAQRDAFDRFMPAEGYELVNEFLGSRPARGTAAATHRAAGPVPQAKCPSLVSRPTAAAVPRRTLRSNGSSVIRFKGSFCRDVGACPTASAVPR
jgi:hypothetical protein